MASSSSPVIDLPATSPAKGITNNISRSGPAPSASEIPLLGGLSASHSLSSVPSTLSADDRDPDTSNAARPAGTRRSGSPPRAPVPPATAAAAATTTEDDVSKLDIAIMACTTGLLVPVALHVKDLTSSWRTGWKVLYGILMVLSFVSTVVGFLSAWCPAVPWARRLTPSCARFGLVVAAALFVVFITCNLGRFGCAAGVSSAAAVVVVLVVVWTWSEQPTR